MHLEGDGDSRPCPLLRLKNEVALACHVTETCPRRLSPPLGGLLAMGLQAKSRLLIHETFIQVGKQVGST